MPDEASVEAVHDVEAARLRAVAEKPVGAVGGVASYQTSSVAGVGSKLPAPSCSQTQMRLSPSPVAVAGVRFTLAGVANATKHASPAPVGAGAVMPTGYTLMHILVTVEPASLAEIATDAVTLLV